jgi:hypothetical protein
LVDFDEVHVNVETHGLRKKEGKNFLFRISLLYSICFCKIGEEWRGMGGIQKLRAIDNNTGPVVIERNGS